MAFLGHVDCDQAASANERITFRVPARHWDRFTRNKMVKIIGGAGQRDYLGKIVRGPFFPVHRLGADAEQEAIALGEIEVQGEIVKGRVQSTHCRPGPGTEVFELDAAEVRALLNCSGDMLLGHLGNDERVLVSLRSDSKSILPRNVGIFGTVGSGKSNTTQVIVEEASARGWAVIMLDVEGEYTQMDAPNTEGGLVDALEHFKRVPIGLSDFQVYYPVTCAGDRKESEQFTLRASDFDVDVIADIIETTGAERNALRECMEHFQNVGRTSVRTSELDELKGLIEVGPNVKRPFTIFTLIQRARERGPRSTADMDYLGLSFKLGRLQHANVVDHLHMNPIDARRMVHPGRVSVIDVSLADEMVKSLVTADLLRKVFAYKILNEEAVPTLVVIEEAHTFISRQDARTMQATLQMLRTVSRRGRKRWLGLVFVSQQPGHLPQEIFELCNTRIVHTVRSLHNLEALMATASDVAQETWARCPLLRPGEAVVSSPQLDHPCEVKIRPAASYRRFVR